MYSAHCDADLQNLTLDLLLALQGFRVSRLLRSSSGGKNLFSDLSKFSSAANSDDFDLYRIKPLLRTVLADELDDEIWDQVYYAVAESTPPPRAIALSLQQTPWFHNTSSFANSSEYHRDVDKVLKLEFGPLYIRLRDFHETFFGDMADLGAASEAFFKQYTQGSNPLFDDGWIGWPKDANQDDVLSWFADFIEKLAVFVEDHKSTTYRQRPLAQSNKPI